ncbi:hypothetical protein EDB19DRAFT_1099707 [Suillus lakei]|nr:hypothetical protein EDB19DRAFT_1099707 [Suillus lakei]
MTATLPTSVADTLPGHLLISLVFSVMRTGVYLADQPSTVWTYTWSMLCTIRSPISPHLPPASSAIHIASSCLTTHFVSLSPSFIIHVLHHLLHRVIMTGSLKGRSIRLEGRSLHITLLCIS